MDGIIKSKNQIIREDIKDTLALLDPTFSPITSYLLNSGGVLPVAGPNYSWVDHKVRRVKTNLSAALTAGTTTMTVVSNEPFVVGGTARIDDELVQVTAVSGTTITITRGYRGTTDSAHAALTPIISFGIEMKEGGNFKDSQSTLADKTLNNTGFIYESFKVTDTAQASHITGQSGMSAYALESMKKKTELMGFLENKLLNSIQYDSGDERETAGAKQLIAQKGIPIDAGGANLTKQYIDDIVKLLVDAGAGNALGSGRYTIVAPYVQKNKIDNYNLNTLRTGIQEKITGLTITQLVTTGGLLNVMYANSLNPNEILIMDLEQLKFRQLIPIKEEMVGRTGNYTQYVFNGEMGVMLTNLAVQTHIYNLSI